MASIQGIYIALFGRPADPLGLAYFNEVTGDGADLAAISDLAATAEYQDRFEGMSNVQIINSIYQSLFGRDADLAGLTFFAQALQDGTFNINNIAIAILDGAQGDDLATVNNKIEAANAFTAALDTGAEVVAYQGDGAAAQGRAFLSGITEDDATVPTASQVDAAIAAIVADPDGGSGEPQVFTLTNTSNAITGGVDTINGGTGDDTIRAILGTSLDSTDIIDGGAGSDVLTVADGAIGTAAGANAPVISNVERINNGDDQSLNLANVTGAQQIWTQDNNGTYTNASTSTVFGSQGATAGRAISVDFAGSLAGATAVSIAIANSNASGDATFDFGTDADGIESISVTAAAGNAGDVILTNGTPGEELDNLETITVAGAGNVTVVAANSLELTTFDASAATGSVSFTSAALTEDVTVTGGSGNDTLNFANATSTSVVTVNGGAGNDVISTGAADDVIDGGAGNDIINGSVGEDAITLGAGDDVVRYTAGTASTIGDMDVIADFNVSGNDTIDLSGFLTAPALVSAADLTLAQNAVSALAASASVTDAVNAAFTGGAVGANEAVYFQFQGNTYVAVNGDADTAFDANEFVVELTGSVALSASDFTL